MTPTYRACAAGLMLLASFTSPLSAQPAATGGAVSVETALFKASDAMGILRGLKQEDSQVTLEYWGTGTVDVAGKAVQTTAYRGSVRFLPVFSAREDFTTGAVATRTVRALAGTQAWDESTPGTFVAAAPADAGRERALRFLSLPSAAIKSARAAGDRTTISASGDKTILAFPLVAVDGATMTVTLTPQFLVERVEAKQGELVVESTYAKYGDWNEKDYKSDVQFPQRLTQRVGGRVVLDLTITKTNTYNPYVVVPVPPALKGGGGKS